MVTLAGGDSLQEWCYANGGNGTYAYDAAITALRVLSSARPAGRNQATGQARTGAPAPPGPAR